MYLQVAQLLKRRIRLGEYKASDVLPSVRDLSRELRVTHSIVHRAVRVLRQSGIVATQHGKEMLVASESPCEQAAALFGFIHPYLACDDFGRLIQGCANEAFEDRLNLLVSRTSKNNAGHERHVAEHLVGNGVKGLLVWAIDNDPNGEYFAELSRRIPVVLVDRLMAGADLPAVTHDHYGAGRDIVRYFLRTLKRRRLLVFMDNLQITAYDDMLGGISAGAQELGRDDDVLIERYPMVDILEPITHGDYSIADMYRDRVAHLLSEGGYDGVFTNNGPFLDRVVVETGLADRFKDVKYATLSNRGIHTGSRHFSDVAPVQWDMDFSAMIAMAADLLQEQVFGRRTPARQVYAPIRRLHSRSLKTVH